MKRSLRLALLAAVVAALAVFAAACGGDGDGGQGAEEQETGPVKGKKGGSVTILAAGDVDYVDPGQTYYTFGYMVHYAVNRTLYSFKPDDSVTPVPDLAADKPQISSDNKTITVKIKPGVKYAPPVNREVKAADIKYAFERAFSANVPNGYAGAYFNSIVGAPDKPGEIREISGITTPDDYTIVFKLTEAAAPLVSSALVMPITTPVPEEYARKFDRKTPSTYDEYVAFTGPYMIENDRETGKLTGWSRAKQIKIVRNPSWNAKTDYRPAYLDAVTVSEGNEDLAVASRRTLQGSKLVCCGDAASPPAEVLKSAVERNRDQLAIVPGGGTRYIALNTEVEPFDNVNIRKAVIAAMDRSALLLTRGGRFIGEVAGGWLPPGIPGFEEAGGLKQNTDLDFLKSPTGDPEVAKKYMLAAKEDDPSLPIDSQGRWTGAEEIVTVGDAADPAKKTAEATQGQLEKLGFKVNLRLVTRETMYTKFCGVPKREVPICPSVGWFKDFADPQSMLDATFNGDNILDQNNVNWPQLDVPAINQAMKQAATTPVGKERNDAWANINKMIAEQAPAVPYSWDKSVNLGSKDVQVVANGYYTATDLSYTTLK
jgi:peptide/nickel transport system substrate-binding protein